MKSGKLPVRGTRNFGRNLEEIEAFLNDMVAPLAFAALLDRLRYEIIPNLESFPELGADFLHRAPLSGDGKALFGRVASLLGPAASLRQLIAGDYIVLYASTKEAVFLLSIRHHRQLSFDFTAHWP